MLRRIGCCVGIAFGAFLGCAREYVPLEYRPQTQQSLEEGRALAQGIGGCGFCHGATAQPGAALTGGAVITDSFGDVHAPNLTRISPSWTLSDIVRAIRISMTGAGRRLGPESHQGYQWMSDEDAYSIAAYLRSLKPAGTKHETRKLDSFERVTNGFNVRFPNDPGFVPPSPKRFVPEYGQYLVDRVAQCGVCHTTPETTFSEAQYLAGGAVVRNGVRFEGPAITRDALSGWTAEELTAFLSRGIRPDGRRMRDGCPTQFWSRGSKEQIDAMVAYLLGK